MRVNHIFIQLVAAWLLLLTSTNTVLALSSTAKSSLGDITIDTLFIEISKEDSNFTVIDARFDETATSSSNAGSDDEKADVLRDTA